MLNKKIRIEEIVELPDTITNMRDAFAYCMSLEKIAEIPQNVEILEGTFEGCAKLGGIIKINSNQIKSYTGCFGFSGPSSTFTCTGRDA